MVYYFSSFQLFFRRVGEVPWRSGKTRIPFCETCKYRSVIYILSAIVMFGDWSVRLRANLQFTKALMLRTKPHSAVSAGWNWDAISVFLIWMTCSSGHLPPSSPRPCSLQQSGQKGVRAKAEAGTCPGTSVGNGLGGVGAYLSCRGFNVVAKYMCDQK